MYLHFINLNNIILQYKSSLFQCLQFHQAYFKMTQNLILLLYVRFSIKCILYNSLFLPKEISIIMIMKCKQVPMHWRGNWLEMTLVPRHIMLEASLGRGLCQDPQNQRNAYLTILFLHFYNSCANLL